MLETEKSTAKGQKQENKVFSQKMSFIAGIVVILTVINDTTKLIVAMPKYVDVIESIFCFLLLFLACKTNKLDKFFCEKRVENFGGFLTVYSILVFAFERMVVCFSSDKMKAIFIFAVLAMGCIIGVFCLLCGKNPKKK